MSFLFGDLLLNVDDSHTGAAQSSNATSSGVAPGVAEISSASETAGLEPAGAQPALPSPAVPSSAVKPELAGGGRTNLILAVTAFVLALIGAFYFKALKSLLDGAVFFGAAIAAFLVLTLRDEASRSDKAAPSFFHRALASIRGNPVRYALVIFSLVLAYTGVRMLRTKAGNQQYWDVFWVWVGSFVCYAAAFVRVQRPALGSWWRTYRLEVVFVLGLTGVAAVLRFAKLGEIPNIVGGDEGQIGLMAQSVLNGELNNMLATMFGHSTLYLYLIAMFIKSGGVANAQTLRITAALAGTLTVPAVYIFARRFFNWRVAVVAASLVTVSHFHLHFSRIVVAGSIQDALFATIAFYLFLSGLENRSATRLTLSGLVMGLHIYIYMGARLVILFIPVYLVALLITNPKLVRENLGNLLIFAGMLMVVAAPMGLWAIQHPADFNARANQIGVIQSGWLNQETLRLNRSKLGILLTLLAQAFLTVNYYPATAFYNATLPILDYLTGAVFVLGLAYSLAHVTDRRHLLLNGWFWSAVVVGGALVVLPAAAAYRILIMFPVVCVFVGLAWDRLAELGSKSMASPRLGAGIATAIFILLFSVLNLRAYFVDYGPSCRYEDWGTRFASYMGDALGKAGPNYKAYLLGYPHIWYGIHPSVDYLSGKIPISDIKEPLANANSFQSPGGKAIFFFTPDREGELVWVRQAAPGGEVRRISDCGNPMMTIYQVDSASPQ